MQSNKTNYSSVTADTLYFGELSNEAVIFIYETESDGFLPNFNIYILANRAGTFAEEIDQLTASRLMVYEQVDFEINPNIL